MENQKIRRYIFYKRLIEENKILLRSIVAFNISVHFPMSLLKKHYYPIFKNIVNYSYDLRVEPDNTLIGECVTDTFTHITGFTPEEINDCGGWLSLIHVDDMPCFIRHFNYLISGQPNVTEFRIVTKNGDVRWICDYAQPIWGERQNRVVRIYGTAQDITKYKQYRETLGTPPIRNGLIL